MSSGATTEHMVSSPARAAPENCGQGERALWSAVVQQAIDDVMDEPIGSLIYDDAVAFFTHTGEWAVSRTHIADELGIHADAPENLPLEKSAAGANPRSQAWGGSAGTLPHECVMSNRLITNL